MLIRLLPFVRRSQSGTHRTPLDLLRYFSEVRLLEVYSRSRLRRRQLRRVEEELIEKGGLLEQPATFMGHPRWAKRSFPFGEGGAQMFAYGVNSHKLNDVISSLVAHGYWVAWLEQIRSGEEISFRQHSIVNKDPSENLYGVKFSHLLRLIWWTWLPTASKTLLPANTFESTVRQWSRNQTLRRCLIG